jgi:hypothetical protein
VYSDLCRPRPMSIHAQTQTNFHLNGWAAGPCELIDMWRRPTGPLVTLPKTQQETTLQLVDLSAAVSQEEHFPKPLGFGRASRAIAEYGRFFALGE